MFAMHVDAHINLASFALLSSMQVIQRGEHFHQRTRFEIP
jgi:hypothetical protein